MALTKVQAGQIDLPTLAGQTAPFTVRAITADDTVEAGEFLDIDATLGDVTVTLPSPVGNDGKMIALHKSDASSNSVLTDGGTVQGTDLSFNRRYTTIVLMSIGTDWRII